jgi:hypothetical protein
MTGSATKQSIFAAYGLLRFARNDAGVAGLNLTIGGGVAIG